jgi:hypothetical protein
MKRVNKIGQKTWKSNKPCLQENGIARDGVLEAYCPGSRCTPQDGMGKTMRQHKALQAGGNGGCVLCVRREEQPLFYSHRGRWTGSAGGKTNSQKTNRTVSYSFSTQANRFSFHVTVQFRSPVMRDKKKGSAPRHIPQTVARARRDEAGGGGGGARVREPSPHTLLPQGEELTLYVGPTPSKLARLD